MSFANRLKVARLNKGLTLQEVGKAINKTDATVQRYENGSIKTIKTDILEKLAVLLEVSPSYLMGWENTEFDKVIVSNLKNNTNKSEIEELLKITDINFKSNINWIFSNKFNEEQQKQILLDFNDVLFNNKKIIEELDSITIQWNTNFEEFLELNYKIDKNKIAKDIKYSFYNERINNSLNMFSDFIKAIPTRFTYLVEDKKMEMYFDKLTNNMINPTIAAHRTNGNNSDIKNSEGLKDLIRELINEEKNK